MRAWIRNILNDDNVTGKYLTSDTSGFYRNYFLTEPRIYGVSFATALPTDQTSQAAARSGPCRAVAASVNGAGAGNRPAISILIK